MSSIRIIGNNVIHRLAETWFFLSPLFFCRNTAKIAKGCNFCHHFQNAAQGSKAHRPRGGSTSQGSAPGSIRRTAAHTRPRAGHQHRQPGPSRTATPASAPAGAALRAAAFEANRPLSLAGQALAALSLVAKHQPGQELATRTHQARPSLAGQGVAWAGCCFACWGVCGIFRTKKTRHGAGWVNRKGGSGLLAARWRPL